MKILLTLTATAVIGLLFACCPPAIAGLVIAVVVWVAVKTGSLWSWSHIGQESEEIVAPFFTHRNASAAVVCVADEFRLVASVLCATPRRVLRAFLEAMFKKRFAGLLGSMETASLRRSLDKMSALHYSVCAAVAYAIPSSLSVLRAFGIKGEHRELSASAASKIYKRVSLSIAATTNGGTADHIRPDSNCSIAALTHAFPASASGCMNICECNYGQAAKCFTGKVFEVMSVLGRFLFSHDASAALWLGLARC